MTRPESEQIVTEASTSPATSNPSSGEASSGCLPLVPHPLRRSRDASSGIHAEFSLRDQYTPSDNGQSAMAFCTTDTQTGQSGSSTVLPKQLLQLPVDILQDIIQHVRPTGSSFLLRSESKARILGTTRIVLQSSFHSIMHWYNHPLESGNLIEERREAIDS